MFFGFSVVYGLRVNLSVAMVAMVNTTDPDPGPNSSVVRACPLPPEFENTSSTFLQPAGVTTPQFTFTSVEHHTLVVLCGTSQTPSGER